jgi:hypothetical protein
MPLQVVLNSWLSVNMGCCCSSASGEKYPVLFDVNANITRAHQLLDIMEDGGYLDSTTKAAKLEIVLLNLEDKSLIMLTITAEYEPKGGISFEHQLTFLDTSPYENSDDWSRLVLELIFLVLLTGLLWKEISEMRHETHKSGTGSPMAYFSDVYNVTDLLGYALRIVMVSTAQSYYYVLVY